MNLIDMYSSKVNSPVTTLTSSLTSVAAGTIETVDITDTNSLPAAPGIATIGVGPTAETIKYTDITGSTLTIERGFEGPTGNWTAGTPIGRFFTSYDYESLKGNIENLNSEINAPAYSTIATTKLAVTPFTTGTLDAPMLYQAEGVSVANTVISASEISLSVTSGEPYYLKDDGGLTTSTGIQRFEAYAGEKWFVYFKADPTSTVLIDRIFTNDGSAAVNFDFADTLEVYGINTMLSDNLTNFIGVRASATGNLVTSEWFAINMTQYGITDFTEAQMLDLVHAMQSGTDIQSAIVDIKSVGKNLFDKTQITQNTRFIGNLGDIQPTTNSFVSDYIKIKAGESYIISPHIEDTRGYVALFDSQKNPLANSTITDDFTATVDGYVRFGGYNFNLEETQLEQSTTATAYEPYKSNTLAPQIELKSLPNGVADTLENAVVDPNDSNKLLRLDKVRHTKNVQEYTIQSGDITAYVEGTNAAAVLFDKNTDYIGYNTIATEHTNFVINSFISSGSPDWDFTSQVGKVINGFSQLSFVLVVEKFTYADLTAAKTDLTGTVIQYQLAEPIVTELDLDEMYSFENGTLYQNGMPSSIDYSVATNQSAVLKEIGDNVERIDDTVGELSYNLLSMRTSDILNTQAIVTPFTTGTLDAPVKYQMEGVSVANSVENNDFSDGTTEWTVFGSVSLSVSSNIMSVTGGGGTPYVGLRQSLDFYSNKYFIYSKVKVDNSDCSSINILSGGADIKYEVENPTSGKWYELYTIGTSIDDTTLDIRHSYPDATTANGKVMEVDGNAGVYAINMTQYGITDFTEAQMLDLVHAMQSGTDIQSAIVDIKSVGKNLFDAFADEFEQGTIAATNGNLVSSTITIRNSNFKRIEGNETHTFNFDTGFEGDCILYDINENFVGNSSTGFENEITFTTPEQAYYYKFRARKTSLAEIIPNEIKDMNLQLEKGTTATAYEPYKQNLLAPQIELKSLPNGVADELSNAVVDPNDSNKLLRLDKVRHTKGVGSYTLQSADISDLFTTGTNTDFVEIVLSTIGVPNGVATQIQGFAIVENFTNEIVLANRDSLESIGSHMYGNTTMNLVFAKGTYATLAEAQADLAGTVIQYQLAEPIVTELDLDEMYSFENGVLYQNGIPASIDYTTATNQGAVLSEVAKTVEKIDDSYASKYQEPWIEPTLLNGWVNYAGACSYYKDEFDIVHLKGKIKGSFGVDVFKLPEGYRPNVAKDFPSVGLNSVFAHAKIYNTGELQFEAGSTTWVSIDGISFKAGE